MRKRLENKVAIVTGATRGIGQAIARMFADEGAAVVITGRHADAGAEVLREIESAQGQAIFVQTDLSNENDVQAMVETTIQHFGKLTTLVNNAAATDFVGPGRGDGPVAQVTNEGMTAVWGVGLHGFFWTCRHAIPHLAKAEGSSIVNISAHSAIRGLPGFAAYTASKGAMNALTREIAVEHAADGIRCNAISTGFIESGPWTRKFLEGDERAREKLERQFLTRLGTPDDIAYAATYLASDEAAIVTGVILPVDGGLQSK